MKKAGTLALLLGPAIGAALLLRAGDHAPGAPAAIAPSRDSTAVAPPVARPGLVETGEAVPGDVTVEVGDERDGRRVTVRRAGHLVSLRLGATIAGGRGAASLVLSASRPGAPARSAPPSLEPGPELRWEATHLSTVATARGLVRLDGGGGARLAMAEPPRIVQRLEGRGHRCVGLDDALGGFSALCTVRAAQVEAASLTAEGSRDDVWITDGARAGEKVVRVDLPLGPAEVAAGAIGYRAGGIGVVVRLEASRLGGEGEGRLLLAANEKRQPQPPSLDGWWGGRRIR